MSNPFDGYRARRNPHLRNHHANQWLGATERKSRKRTKMDSHLLYAEADLLDWVRDRAALLGVPITHLLRDVLAEWRNLVIATENKLGENLDGERKEISVIDRLPGYSETLVPGSAHTDAATIGDL